MTARDLVPPSCEYVEFLPAYPERLGTRLTYPVACAQFDVERPRAPCELTIRLEGAGGRSLARGSSGVGRWTYPKRFRIRPTPLGRRLAARPDGVEAVLRHRVKNRVGTVTTEWAIRLRLRQGKPG